MTNSTDQSAELRTALERLFSLQTFGIKLGLEPIARLLDAFGNPHRAFPAIHIAGTNGKGSVSAMLAAVLQSAGLRVGLYTSPHLLDFSERIRVNGAPIETDRLALYAREMLPVIEEIGCTFFEGTTAMGFRYFAEEKVDIAIVETGMGGRLDATNIVQPLACAITSISFDHMKHLGNTLEKIAFEKAGIMKESAPTVVGHIAPRLRTIFEEKGTEVDAPVYFTDQLCRTIYHSMSFDEVVASFMIERRELPRLRIGLTGRHQIENARVALGVIHQLRSRYDLSDEIVREGFRRVRELTGIRGRFETVTVNPRVIVDVAHNADGARVLIDTLQLVTAHRGRARFVYGAVEDKDVREIVALFRPMARMLYAVRAESDRSLPSDEIAFAATETGVPTVDARTVHAGIEAAMSDAASDEIIVVCGSFYVVAEALAMLGEIPAADRIYERSEVAHHDALEARDADETSLSEPIENGATHGSRHLSVKEWNRSEQPRERLMTLGPKALSESELLAILLRTGRKGEDVIQVSRNILNHFGSLKSLAGRDYRELQHIDGIGPTKAVTLAAAFEIGRRIEGLPFHNRPTIESPADVASLYIPLLRDTQKEQFHVLILNTANKVVRMHLVSEGNLNSSIVHPREVFRIAIVENAASLIGLHNHPSGNPTPSKEDIAITKQLVETGRVIGIPFHDHVIIAGDNYVSLAELGYI